MPKINQKEYDLLKQLDDKWKWIARDSDSPGKWFANSLEVYTDKPEKTEDTVWTNGNGSEKLNKDFFQFIQWSDEEPYNIQELIEEYEDEEYGYFNMKLSREYEQFIEESEETEVKNIEWLKEAFNKAIEFRIRPNPSSEWGMGSNSVLRHIKNDFEELLNQLDEPEVLSQEWIDENAEYADEISESSYKDVAVVRIDKLQNLLVPKQEDTARKVLDIAIETGKLTDYDKEYIVIEKPTVPQFVADYIQEGHEIGSDLSTALTFATDHLNDIKKYIRDNEETFARAWLAYPNIEVEEEQKYRVVIGNYVLRKWNNSDTFQIVLKNSPKENTWSGCKIELTEKEIKAIDERFWAFAVPVEEEEE